MDAVKFLKEYHRMCRKYAYMEAGGEDCSSECPFYGEHYNLLYDDIKPIDAVSKVEQWSKEHPQKTIMDDFFKKFPNALRTKRGFPVTCAKELGYGRLDSCSFGIKGAPGTECGKCWERTLEDK